MSCAPRGGGSCAPRGGGSCAPEAAPRGVGCCPARWNLRRRRALRRKLLRAGRHAALWMQCRPGKPEGAPRGGSWKLRRLCVLFSPARYDRAALVGTSPCLANALPKPTGVAGPASDWGLAEKQAPMRMRLTAPMRTPAKTKTKRTRHAHAELAAAEPVLRNSPEAPPIMAANLDSANQTRNESQQARSSRRKQHQMSIKTGSNEA